jgi:hypothetical protein
VSISVWKTTTHASLATVKLLGCIRISKIAILAGRPDGRRPFGRPREDNIKMDLQEMGWGCMEQIDLV